MLILGYRVVNKNGESWAGVTSPLSFAEARDHLVEARKTCPTSWRMVSVNAKHYDKVAQQQS